MFFAPSKEVNEQLDTRVRVAQSKDVSELASTIVACFYDFHPLLSWIKPMLQLSVSEDLRYRLKNSPLLYRCLVATSNSEIAGTVEIALQKPWWSLTFQAPYISNLAVKNTYRRQGIARKLLTQCEQVSRSWGYQEICLHVLAENHSAQKLYLGMGYKFIPEAMSWHWGWHCLFPHSDSRLLMKKELDNLD